MKANKLAGLLMIMGGLMELIIVVLHIVWPFDLVRTPIFNTIPTEIASFIVLASLALALCMLIFSFFSFYFSKGIQYGKKSAWVFCLSQSFLWMVRLILEILLPVKLPLYLVENPSSYIIVGSLVIALLYIVPVFIARKTQTAP